jgi:hypothetical protein
VARQGSGRGDAELRVLLTAERHEEALAAGEGAIAAWTVGGNGTVGEYAQSVLTAASIEGERLGRRRQAAARLAAAIPRCREAGEGAGGQRAVSSRVRPGG